MEELNCLELKVESAEEEYVTYKCEADNRLIGQALKKAYDKKMKEKIANLSSAELKEYLEKGSIMLGEIKIDEGWLKVEKVFNEQYSKSEDHGCNSNATTSVLLHTKLDDNLKKMGYAREVTNRIQKLRKSEGVSIDDKIEVFFKVEGGDDLLKSIVDEHGDRIQKAIKMPFLPASQMKEGAEIIGKTFYSFAEDSADKIELTVCKA